MTEQNPYDAVRYPGTAYSQTHPDRLAVIARLLGLQPPPLESCRVLELGCGDGGNLLPMAFALPGAQITGVDLSGEAIAAGRAGADAVGLQNLHLHHADLMEFNPAAGSFDYIIAHGVYSWTPDAVRDRILGLCRHCLAPQGVAYVSYNTYPGCHIRNMVREMMLYHVKDIGEAAARMGQARAVLKFLANSREHPDVYHTILQKELKGIEDRSDASLYHDDLNPITHPVYFHQFVAHAQAHSLRYLSEAMFMGIQPDELTPATVEALEELGDNVIAREQYHDFLTGCRFRRTLLCRAEIELDYNLQPEALTSLLASLDLAEPEPAEADLRSPLTREFKTSRGASITTNRPLAKAALHHLGTVWPRPVPFGELLTAARSLARAGNGEEGDAADLRELLARGFAAGTIDLHTWAPPVAAAVSPRPVASPVARYEIMRWQRVTTLYHKGLELRDATARALLGLLDGTRDHEALAECLVALAREGTIEIPGTQTAQPPDEAALRSMILHGLQATLRGFARAAILVN